MGKFHELVSDGTLPKGRIGEDGKRYYTNKDLDFILREWKSKTTAKFLLYTLPLLLVSTLLILMIAKEISDTIREKNAQATPTPRIGYATKPKVWSPATPWPTNPPKPTAVYRRDYYRKYQRNRRRSFTEKNIDDDAVE